MASTTTQIIRRKVSGSQSASAIYLSAPDRENIKAKLADSDHGVGEPISTFDREILLLLLESPAKRPNHCIERFLLYQSALKVYNAAIEGKVPADVGAELLTNSEKRIIYQLIFNVLHYYDVLEEVFIESRFYSHHFYCHNFGILLHIMLYDYQESKFSIPFQTASEVEAVSDAMKSIAKALLQHRTKLNAALARMRVQANIPTISQLVSDPAARDLYSRSALSPMYARVNTLKCTQDEVLKLLRDAGYSKMTSVHHRGKHSKSFYIVEDNFLAFSHDCRKFIDQESFMEGGRLVFQDKSSYRFVKGLENAIENCDGDIIVTEPYSGFEIAHIATFLGDRGNVFVCTSEKRNSDLAKERIATLGVQNVQFIDRPFVSISDEDYIFNDVHMVVCLSKIPPTNVANNVDFILQEGDSVLPFLIVPHGSARKTSMADTETCSACLSTALSLRSVRYVVYASKSNTTTINKNIVTEQLELFNEQAEMKGYLQYILISTTSQNNSDYFTAIIEQEVKPETPPNEIIARAIANGLIDGTGISEGRQAKKSEPSRPRKPKVFKASLTTTISYQQKVVPKIERAPKTFDSRPHFKI